MTSSGDDGHAREQDVSGHLARNVRHLRETRGLTQQQMARLSGLPRATWANLETGGANPTLSVLHRVALALQLSVEELISAPRSTTRHYAAGTLATKRQGNVVVRKLLPDHLPGMELDRMEIPPGGRLTGVPHTPGTREYLTCESGVLVLAVGGEQWTLHPGDVVTFRGDQKHSYGHGGGSRAAVGYSAVVFASGR